MAIRSRIVCGSGNITGGKSVTGVGCLTEYVQESELLALREKYKDL